MNWWRLGGVAESYSVLAASQREGCFTCIPAPLDALLPVPCCVAVLCDGAGASAWVPGSAAWGGEGQCGA